MTTATALHIDVCGDATQAARHAAAEVARNIRQAGRNCVLAVSGGRSPRPLFEALIVEVLPWGQVSVVQVDERIAPADHADRNLTLQREVLVGSHCLHPEHLHAMLVEASDLDAAAREYADVLARLAGTPPVLDIVHLGLGADGHTASLLPGDPILQRHDIEIGITGPYQGRRRMTMTYAILNRARRIVWLVVGADKAHALARLAQGDPEIPAGHIARQQAVVFCDRAAASALM